MLKSDNKKLDLSKFKLIIFDFDGVIADSLGAYRKLDQLLVKELYGIDEEISEFKKLSDKLLTGAANSSEANYYRLIDQTYGDGNKPLDEIWSRVIELEPIVQINIEPKPGVVNVLNYIKKNTSCPVALATGSNRNDINFFSTKESKIGQQINLNEYFDTIITSDDVTNPKPDPESFIKIIDLYETDPESVLIFEDSLAGILAGKSTGATVIAIKEDYHVKNKEKIIEAADMYFEEWPNID